MLRPHELGPHPLHGIYRQCFPHQKRRRAPDRRTRQPLLQSHAGKPMGGIYPRTHPTLGSTQQCAAATSPICGRDCQRIFPPPYHVWAVPLFWWFTFFFALFIACLCITVILRKQWVEHERITFPLAQLPVLMIQDTASGQIGFFKNKLSGRDLGIGAFILSWNILPLFWHNLPVIPIGPTYRTTISFGHDFPPLQVKFNFVMATFGYLTNLEVLLSIWLFHVLSLIESAH